MYFCLVLSFMAKYCTLAGKGSWLSHIQNESRWNYYVLASRRNSIYLLDFYDLLASLSWPWVCMYIAQEHREKVQIVIELAEPPLILLRTGSILKEPAQTLLDMFIVHSYLGLWLGFQFLLKQPSVAPARIRNQGMLAHYLKIEFDRKKVDHLFGFKSDYISIAQVTLW